MSAWTLESELSSLSGCRDLEAALRHFGILDSREDLLQLSTDESWRRGGAETYIYSFRVVTRLGRSQRLILKAHTPTPTGIPLETSFNESLKRRHLLTAAGIAVPRLYYSGKGILLEDYVPFALSDRWADLAAEFGTLESVVEQLFVFAFALDELGFAAIGPFNDIRVDEAARIYAIDFGQDLGPAHMQPNRHTTERALRQWLPLQYHSVCDVARSRAMERLRASPG